MHWVIIPFRGVENAKSRLANVLSEAARRQLARTMFQHVLNVACAAAGPRWVLVVTQSQSTARMARHEGASALQESERDLNGAASKACAHLRGRGATTASVVAADLPLLEPSNVKVLMRAARAGFIGIAPDRQGRGTNAIALPLKIPFRFRFGNDSFRRHKLQCRQSGWKMRLVRQAELAGDIDELTDLTLLPASYAPLLPPAANNMFQGAQ